MKVYVVDRFGAEKSQDPWFSPKAFEDLSKAKAFLKEWIDYILETQKDEILSCNTHLTGAEIEYDDDTYDVFKIMLCSVH